MTNRSGFFTLILVLMVPSTAERLHPQQHVEGSFQRSLSVAVPLELEVTTGSGSIRVRTGDASTVHVTGTIRARDDGRYRAEDKVRALASNPPIEQFGQVVRIGRIDDQELKQNVSISYELIVPPEARLLSRTGSGSQSIDGIRGSVDASTGSGGISISNVGEGVDAKTGSGNIDLESARGNVRANTGSGHIRAIRIAGGFAGRAGSGGVTLEQIAPGDVDIETGSGSVDVVGVQGSLRVRTGSGRIAASGQPAREWNLHASSGEISVRLPSQPSFELYAHTSSGRITIDHPLTVQGVVSPKELRGRVRGGGFTLEARTGSGNIRIQ